MKRLLKWIGLGVGGLVGAIVLLVVVLYIIGGARLNETYDIDVRPVAIPA